MSDKNTVFRKPDCPFGKRAVALLKAKSIPFKDHVFASKEEEQVFKTEQGVKTTPQIFFGNERVGGYTELAQKLGVDSSQEKSETSYVPVFAIFGTAALLALSTSKGVMGFMGFFLALLALQKLIDLKSFNATFEKYDLLTKAYPRYATAYPFIELLVGLGFLADVARIEVGVLSVVVGVVGCVSIFKAVYLDKKDLACGCVGGNSKVPLGVVSMIENGVMAAMGLYVLIA